MAAKPENPPKDFADRVRLAREAAKRSQTRTEREAGLHRGYLSQVKSGKIRVPTPEIIRQLADYLAVTYEWLAIGRGPMHTPDHAPSPLESAMRFAFTHGVRQDAIDAAIRRFEGDDLEMSPLDWVLAFKTEHERLTRAGVPRPEDVAREERKTARKAARVRRELREFGAKKRAKREREAAEAAEAAPPPEPPPKPAESKPARGKHGKRAGGATK